MFRRVIGTINAITFIFIMVVSVMIASSVQEHIGGGTAFFVLVAGFMLGVIVCGLLAIYVEMADNLSIIAKNTNNYMMMSRPTPPTNFSNNSAMNIAQANSLSNSHGNIGRWECGNCGIMNGSASVYCQECGKHR